MPFLIARLSLMTSSLDRVDMLVRGTDVYLFLAVSLSFLVALTACSSESELASCPNTARFEHVDISHLDLTSDAQQLIEFESEKKWEAFWNARSSSSAQAIALDLERNRAIGILSGAKPHPGYTIRLVSACYHDQSGLVVQFAECETGQDAALTVLSYAGAVALVEWQADWDMRAIQFRQVDGLACEA